MIRNDGHRQDPDGTPQYPEQVRAGGEGREVAGLKAPGDLRLGGRPRKMDVPMLRMAMTAMASRETNAQDLARRLGFTTTTLYMYVNGDGTVKEPGQKLLDPGSESGAGPEAT